MSCEFTPGIVPSSGAIAQEPVLGDDCLTGLLEPTSDARAPR
jgi:hypothetical protein